MKCPVDGVSLEARIVDAGHVEECTKCRGLWFPKGELRKAKDSAKRVLLASVTAWPLAYFALAGWLRHFAYRDKVGIGIFVLSTVLALVVAMATVGWLTVRAALANPVESLRYE